MKPLHVKICGITRAEDAITAVELGADLIGFNFVPDSPRCISPEQAAEIVKTLPKGVEAVGVFVNEAPERVNAIAEHAGLHLAQLHGTETPEEADRVHIPVMKAVRIESEADIAAAGKYRVDLLLIDTPTVLYGGSGKTGNWPMAAKACATLRAFLAGGLDPGNVAEAVRTVKPYGVDVCTGVERAAGVKDPRKMAEFIERARAAARRAE
jgi:phosphoribosylanthranilate isomerase